MMLEIDKSEYSQICQLRERLKSNDLKLEGQVDDIFSWNSGLVGKKKNTELYNINKSIYLTLDRNFLIKDLNFQAANFLGIDGKTLIDKPFINFLFNPSKTIFEKNIQAIFQDKKNKIFAVELLAKYGRQSVILETTLISENSLRICLVDISDNHQLAAQIFELKEDLHLINSLFQQASDAIAALDSDLTINVINLSFIKIFNRIFNIEIQIGMNLHTILKDFPDLKIKILQACHEALLGKNSSVLIENSSNNKEIYYCYEIQITTVFNEYYKKNELVLCVKNLTEYKLKERLRDKQQLDLALSCRTSAMGEMASALAHEINQPLTAIIAYSRSCLNIIKQKPVLSKNEKKLLPPLEQIAHQAEHAGEIIHTMKNFMRGGNFYREETDINFIIKETLSLLNYELLDFKLKITLHLMENPPKIKANKIHLMQIILNLARNSIEALQGSAVETPELFLETTHIKDYIFVKVKDNGPGIPDKYQHKILNTYFTTKAQGTGIGLGVCRSLIEEHGGKLLFQPQDQNGACFIFSLPIMDTHDTTKK